MHIDNPDALKSWLTHILEPLCDADPAALARYVLALLKKDKDVRELSRCMSEQLDVFLGEETAPFLARLFDSIASETFLGYQTPDSGGVLAQTTAAASLGEDGLPPVDAAGDAAVVAAATTVAVAATTDGLAVAGEFAQQPGESAVPNHDLLIEHASPINSPVRSPQKQQQQQLAVSSSGGSGNSSSTTTTTTTNASHQQPIGASSSASAHTTTSHHKTSSSTAAAASVTSADSRRRRGSARSRTRSRSRSPERSSGRGGRDRDGKSGRPYGGNSRNKSPSQRGSGGGAYDRRGGGNSRSWKSRSRSPVERRKPPQQQQQQQLSPSYGDAATVASAAVGEAKPSGKQQPPPPAPAVAALQMQQRQRCRDFDEKGYCMRGETCPWDHGNDPVVLEDISNPALMSGVPHGRGAEYSPDAPELWTRSGGNFGRNGPNVGGGGGGGGNVQSHRGAQLGGGGGGYNGRLGGGGGNGGNAFRGPPGGGGGLGGNQFPFGLNAPATTPLQRELISVPVLEAGGGHGGGHGHGGGGHGGDISGPGQPKRRYDPEDTVAVAEIGGGGGGGAGHGGHGGGGNAAKRKMPISGRLGPRVPSMQQNCSLELRKVPRGLNSIAHLNNHFSKFGKIVNIQISYDGDAEAAIVTFSTHAEANVAYRSTEAVLNNRFIKVFWHSDANGGKGGDQQLDGGQQQQQQHHHQQSMPPHLRHKGGPNQYSLNNTTHNNNNTNNSNGANTNNGHTVATVGGVVPAVPTAAAATDAKGALGTDTATATAAPATATATGTTASSLHHDAVIRSRLNSRINRHNPLAVGGAANAAGAATTEQLRRKQEDNVKAAVQLAHGLHKRKHDLLQGYLQQLRTCLEMVERTDPSDAQRTKVLETIKSLQASIDGLNKEIAAEQATMQAKMQPHHVQVQMQQRQLALGAAEAAAQMRRSREQHKKELLDIELELFAQQQEGNDTTQLQRRIEELQKSLGASPTKASGGLLSVTSATQHQMHHKQQHQHHQQQLQQQQQQQQQHNQFGGQGQGRGGVGGRVRPAPPGSTSVDRRPTTLRVLGFAAVDSDVLLGHFKHFGEVTRNELDKAVPSLVIAFATRINAEQAMLRGRTFKDKQLQISWVSNPCVPPTGAKCPTVDNSNNTISAAVPLTDACANATANQHAGDTADDDANAVAVVISAVTGGTELAEDALAATPTDRAAAAAAAADVAAAAAAADVNSEEVLLPEDEEEEEDGDETEARSWRR